MSILEGLRVLDVASYIAGPAAAAAMADLCADVVKVEPLGVDPYRSLGRNAGPHNPFWVQNVEKCLPRYAPGIGEHSRAIPTELGYADAVMDSLFDEGVVREPGLGEPH
jgi:crotonobetainyl-CoA:carnitine CoA-transferase CaiB-like acyl-CoA transferase